MGSITAVSLSSAYVVVAAKAAISNVTNYFI
jgi:hypothetical protein